MNLTAIPTNLLANSEATSLATSTAAKDSKNQKLHDAAQQFESLMINEMMKNVKDSSGWLDSEGETGQDTAMEMAQSQFANALAKSGGLGLAKMIEKSIGQK